LNPSFGCSQVGDELTPSSDSGGGIWAGSTGGASRAEPGRFNAVELGSLKDKTWVHALNWLLSSKQTLSVETSSGTNSLLLAKSPTYT